MVKVWLLLDEQGDVKFGARNSSHFGIAAITTFDPIRVNAEIDALRHRAWSSAHISRGSFHAHDDCWQVRASVFAVLARAPLNRCDVVSLHKDSVFPSLRTPHGMYRAALKVLLRHVIPRIEADELMVVASEWNAMRDLRPTITEVLTKASFNHPILWAKPYEIVQAPCASYGGLQLADYVAWASHRRRTRGEPHWDDYVAVPGRSVSDFVVG